MGADGVSFWAASQKLTNSREPFGWHGASGLGPAEQEAQQDHQLSGWPNLDLAAWLQQSQCRVIGWGHRVSRHDTPPSRLAAVAKA
jgi:hypothetical protein